MDNQQATKKEQNNRQTSEENWRNQTDKGENGKNEPHIMPSETESDEVSSATNKAGDPGRTPGKAEGEDV